MNIRTLLVSAGLVGLLCLAAHSQPAPSPGPTTSTILPTPAPTLDVPALPTATPPPPGPRVVPPPAVVVPTPPPEKSVDDLLAELERVQAQKAELDKQELNLKGTLRKKLAQQTARLNKLGVVPKPGPEQSSDKIVPAAYPLTFRKDGPKKDKDEVVVLVVSHLEGTSETFPGADGELATALTHILPEMAKENKEQKKMRVLSTTLGGKFKTINPGEIGQKIGADFVLDIELAKIQLYKPHTAQERIYEGKAEVTVTVYEVGPECGAEVSYAMGFSYPKGMIRDADAIPENGFKKEYIATLAVEIAEHHVDRKADRVGRIIIEGKTGMPEKDILSLLALTPGQVLPYASLEASRERLRKAGFCSVVVELIPCNPDPTIKDIWVRIIDPKTGIAP